MAANYTGKNMGGQEINFFNKCIDLIERGACMLCNALNFLCPGDQYPEICCFQEFAGFCNFGRTEAIRLESRFPEMLLRSLAAACVKPSNEFGVFEHVGNHASVLA